MASTTSFERFYKTWLDHLHHLVLQLRSAPKRLSTQDDLFQVTRLIHRLMAHYTEYYRVKSVAANGDVISVLMAPWATSLERSLHWIAGWRPTTLFHLVYTESSVEFESRVADILRGIWTGDLGDLSPSQFRKISELQCQTVNEENAITNEQAEWQDGANELLGPCQNFKAMIGRLAAVVWKADDLRLRTITNLVELHFGIQSSGREKDHQHEIN